MKAGDYNLTEIRKDVWQLKPFGCMKVPGRIYGDKVIIQRLLDDIKIGKEWNALKQVKNVACLPGLQLASIAMPDIHPGYGFPIGGVGAFDAETGVISLAGVGYDVNCLSGETKILTEHGCYMKISEMENNWTKENLRCMNLTKNKEQKTPIIRFIKIRPKNKVYKITTKSGKEIIATEDHPIWTPSGMTLVKDLQIETKVAVYPFSGVAFEQPKDKTILTEKDILSLDIPCDKRNVIKELKKRNLLPLKLNSRAIPYLIKLLSYNMGDGTLYFSAKKGFAWFYGKAEDLEDIREDIKAIGFTPSKIYKRERSYSIDTKYGTIEFKAIENSIKVSSRSFVTLLLALGAPLGNKTLKEYTVPEWILKSTKWHKRLFLAALFGAEMSAPKTFKNHKFTFYMPAISVDKAVDYVNSGKLFLKQISEMLAEFGIRCSEISEREELIDKDGNLKVRLRLNIAGDPENLIKLYSLVGFEYHRRKRFLANVAAQYLRLKQAVIEKRIQVQQQAIALYKQGTPPKEIYETLNSKYINKRFLERSLFEGRKTEPRIALAFPSFEEFVEQQTRGLGESGMVWDEIIEKREVDKPDFVYDFTVEHNDHNFIANGLVVSNCGVRTIRTYLKKEDVLKKQKELLDELYKTIPAGLGSTGKIKLSEKEIDEVLVKGAEFSIEKGFGSEKDLEFIEEHGRLEGADPSAVSHLAKQRQYKQIGTLGSGNHYLEVQYVDEVFDEKVAKAYKLEKDQVVVSIHCGSRALGHQVGTDYAKFLAEAVKKYKIEIPDKELVCAPFQSPEGQKYYSAVVAAINCAFANRETLAHLTRLAFCKVFGVDEDEIETLYEVGHNTCKIEKHKVDGKMKKLIVHRKGSTRAFGPGRKEIPKAYREVGQPVLIGGTMGTHSWILHGTELGMQEAFGSSCHGAGRLMSRHQAKKTWRGEQVVKELAKKGILVRGHGWAGVAEEAPGAYKDVDRVVNVSHNTGIAKKVVKVKPLVVIKG